MGTATRLSAYAMAVVRIGRPDGDLVVAPRPAGVVEGLVGFPADVLHVLTAHDPGPVRLAAAENARRGHALRAAVGRLPTWPTVASDAAGGHAEAGVLVAGLDDAGASALARRFGQEAVFRWTPWAWSVVACRDGSVVEQGWAVRRLRPGRPV